MNSPYRTAAQMTPAEMVAEVLAPTAKRPSWAEEIDKALSQAYPWTSGTEVCVLPSDDGQTLTLVARRTGDSIHARNNGRANVSAADIRSLPTVTAKWKLIIERAEDAISRLEGGEYDRRAFRIRRRDPKRLRRVS